ncbi:MAG: aminopeptidase P family N-terminal domain-containing protein [Thermomicrobiales bacterium]
MAAAWRPSRRDRPVRSRLCVHAAIAAAIRAVAPGGGRLGVDLELVPTGTLAALREGPSGYEIVDATSVFADLRAVKDATEIDHLRRARRN